MSALPELERRTFIHAFERALAKVPDKVAQTDRSGRWTFAESFDRSLRFAGGLAAAGAGRAAPVALMLDNSMDAIHAWSGLSLTGVVEVPVNTAYKGRFLTHILNDSGAEILLIEDRYCARLARAADDLTSLRTVVVRGGAGDALPQGRFLVVPFEELDAATPASPVRVGPADLIAYMYTSGTTGASKGVLTSHAHAYTYASGEDQVRPREYDSILVTLPVFHLSGQWSGVYKALVHQASCVLEPAFSPTRFWPLVREHGITFTALLGAMAQMLAARPPEPDDADNPLQIVGMAPLVADFQAFRDRFGVDIITAYGMSEIGAVVYGPPDSVVAGASGFRRPGYELRIVDEHGRDLPPGEAGELLVRPEVPHTVMSGYHGLPETTADVLRGGWVHTGDVLREDAEGRYHFVDRLKDALRRRGENVSSFEVESVINDHPSVAESAVVAVASDLTEDDILAVVVPAPGARIDPVALTEFLIDRLPYFMVPRYVEVVAELPKTPTQKVRKAQLRDHGVSGTTWDREAAGIFVRREG
ncbi:AMP-binding protein [Spongiactinospora sp. TRM90649]|uniref:AMP-binding protein n=1 Tax=Spongiactinospora sp. TRM90649 TaxID=3031114 RepID=UPI0023F784E8|nr:AMP-binding protein [Spongiactinospora sp. TRM90649]MDF5752160.1 AMP-binding protein [Spongiactinospora sp. TRM90649]